MMRLLSLLLLFLPSLVFAQLKSSPLKKADAMSVRATLENMLVKRYTQELSSIIDEKHFSLGVKFDLRVVNTERRPQSLEYNDLELGFLDADELFDTYSMPNMVGVNPLEKYTIRGVEVNAGLKPEVGDELKSAVEDWLGKRVKEDFGSNGKMQVQYILDLPQKEQSPPWMKLVQDMQGLVGNLVLALAILFGIVLWKVLGGSGVEKNAEGGGSQSISINSKTEMGEGASGFGGAVTGIDSDEVKEARLQSEHLKTQIREMAPKVMDQLESLVSEWCDQGEKGLFLLASFAEITGSVLGSLPIPKEEKKKMSSIFAQMHETPITEKVEYLNRVYWDLISALNLGTESLHRPFSFVGSSGLGTLNNVLLGNDLETQTVVSLYMPDKMRKRYFEGLEDDKKIDLLNSAAKLTAISEENLQNIEDHLAPYFGENELEESTVPMDLTFTKLVEAMSFTESCAVLPTIEGPVMDKFKRTVPHIGLMSQWEKSAISSVAKYASNEALLAYIRVVPDMKHYVLEFVPPRTKQILEDDLNQGDSISADRKEELLANLNALIVNLVENGELSLEEVMQIADNSSDEKIDVAA